MNGFFLKLVTRHVGICQRRLISSPAPLFVFPLKMVSSGNFIRSWERKALHCHPQRRGSIKNNAGRESVDTKEKHGTNDMCHNISCSSCSSDVLNTVGSPVTTNFTVAHPCVRLIVVFQGNRNCLHPCRAIEEKKRTKVLYEIYSTRLKKKLKEHFLNQRIASSQLNCWKLIWSVSSKGGFNQFQLLGC